MAEAWTGAQALELFHQHRPDITLMDLRLPDIFGTEVIQLVRKEFLQSKFIALTSCQGDEDIYTAIQAGVQGYLFKGMHREVLIEAIQAVHKGQRRIPSEVVSHLSERTSDHGLIARELEIIRLIAKGQSDREIAATLSLADNTVKWYIRNILSKLGVNNRTLAAITSIQRGIIHID